MKSIAKNFASQNLQGKSFKGQDLTGADFSGADIRSADFSNAILKGANFSKAETGIQNRWLFLHLIVMLLISAVSGLLEAFAGFWIAVFFNPTNIKSYVVLLGISIILVLGVMIFAIVRQGFTAAAFITVATAITITGFFAGVGAGFWDGTRAVVGAGVWTGASAVAVVGVVTVAGAWAGAVAVTGVWTCASAITIAAAVSIAAAVAVAEAVDVSGVVAGSGVVGVSGVIGGAVSGAGVIAGATVLLSIYMAWRVLEGDPKFDILLKFGVAVASFCGTSFRGANLNEADFTEASLKGSDFRNSRNQTTSFTLSIWKYAKNLDRSRLGKSILSNLEVRDLLITGKPNESKSYEGLDLRGANLGGVYLEKINFKRAIISEANFSRANLEWANLTEVQAVGTDFTYAQLTGACIESWNYDHTTKLDNVDCRFVFELEHPNINGSRERRPHDPDKEFEEGDFTSFYSETKNVVQLLIRNGIRHEAFRAGWQKVAQDYPNISSESIQEIKKKGENVQITISVSEDTDKGEFERNFDRSYKAKLKELEATHQNQLLEAKIDTLKQSITDIKDILQIAKSPNINVSPTFQNEAKAMTEQNPITIKAGRDISGVINLGKIEGNVTNAINQLPDHHQGDKADIKILLKQLQEAISDNKDLDDEDKADALEQVESLAKIAVHDKPEEKRNPAGKAVRALNRIIVNIPNAMQIIQSISKIFGLL
ncbi:pentapeptide repeat-containing protein [Pseudanabaena sp. Chao 1811]|uniref:pentapeptide repeat-containing protein n=1 Tax=Pseudanabaena sp. Chao 1811 TaxID=2963092 RepID=UPI0022F40371|nr:pentapeptide repeat-containing protein [Pseudanabaena sp. Chao 1811]